MYTYLYAPVVTHTHPHTHWQCRQPRLSLLLWSRLYFHCCWLWADGWWFLISSINNPTQHVMLASLSLAKIMIIDWTYIGNLFHVWTCRIYGHVLPATVLLPHLWVLVNRCLSKNCSVSTCVWPWRFVVFFAYTSISFVGVVVCWAGWGIRPPLPSLVAGVCCFDCGEPW